VEAGRRGLVKALSQQLKNIKKHQKPQKECGSRQTDSGLAFELRDYKVCSAIYSSHTNR
jgi:hypothetical protein